MCLHSSTSLVVVNTQTLSVCNVFNEWLIKCESIIRSLESLWWPVMDVNTARGSAWVESSWRGKFTWMNCDLEHVGNWQSHHTCQPLCVQVCRCKLRLTGLLPRRITARAGKHRSRHWEVSTASATSQPHFSLHAQVIVRTKKRLSSDALQALLRAALFIKFNLIEAVNLVCTLWP